MISTNYLIINRKPTAFELLAVEGGEAVFMDADGIPLDDGVIELDDTVYAALFCDEVRNITLVTAKTSSQDVVTILFREEGAYQETKRLIEAELDLEMSKQNIKLNRYAESIAEKLAIGVELKVTDALDNSEMVECPECGMMNLKGSPYCMDCGAELAI